MQLTDFDYHLPEAQIAQAPLAQRGDSRLLEVQAEGLEHRHFHQIHELLKPGDLLVLNNTRVIKARLYGRKPTGGAVEILVERVLADANQALCQIKSSKPLRADAQVLTDGGAVTMVRREAPFYVLEFPQDVLEFLDLWGHVPLPPYIERSDEAQDSERYQTVFGSHPGAVAAPTAGLHFDAALLDQLKAKGVDTCEVTLHVGAGTFQPVRGDLAEHTMHSERYELPAAALQAIQQTQAQGGRVVAVGTTVVRTLESVAAQYGELRVASGETQLFIQPGFQFKVVDALITNFHLPKSTLLMLVSAFAGYQTIMNAYRVAVDEGYRFFSYGDAMWLTRSS